MVKIATWNVNSVRSRLPILLDWLGEAAPDVVLLQETKCTDDQFPRLEIEDKGYNIETHGQKSYNGVVPLPPGALGRARARGDGGPAQAHPLGEGGAAARATG